MQTKNPLQDVSVTGYPSGEGDLGSGSGGSVNGGTTGTNTGSGGAGGTSNSGDNSTPPVQQDPCAKAKPAAQNATNIAGTSGYASGLDAVKNAAADGKEHSVAFNNIDGVISSSTVSNGSETSTSTPIGENTVATLHNHQNNVPPSPGDLYEFINANKKYPNFTTKYVVVGNTMYAFVITDRDAAAGFVTNYPESQVPGASPDFPIIVFDDYDNARNGLYSLLSNEIAMAYVLDKYNTGIALLKQDTDGNFKKLNTIVTNQSDGSLSYTQANCP